MESSRPRRFQQLTILALGQKFEDVVHQLWRHAGQAIEYLEIRKGEKPLTAPYFLSPIDWQPRECAGDEDRKKNQILLWSLYQKN